MAQTRQPMQNGHVVRANGTQEWYLYGQLHREGDQPARICADGTRWWFLRGQRHREGDQPARILPDGTQEWWRNNRLHREDDQPARIWASGTQEWWQSGQRHREGGQPAVVCADGTQEWWTRDTKTCTTHVTDFRETSDRFALVQAVVAIALSACAPCGTGSALSGLLQAVQCCGASSYHVAHEHAFLVALFL